LAFALFHLNLWCDLGIQYVEGAICSGQRFSRTNGTLNLGG
jgi:hypothetical protein